MNATHRQKQRDWILKNLPQDAIALGIYEGVDGTLKFGKDPDVDTAGNPKTLWPGAGLYPFQTGSFSLEVLSSSADDDVAGTGTRTLMLAGLAGDDWEQTFEVLTMDGITPVTSARSDWKRMPRAWSITSGSNGNNVGTITVRVPGPGDTQAIILPSAGQTQMGIFTVPGLHVGVIGSWSGKLLKTGGATVEVNLGLFTRDSSVADASWRLRDELDPLSSGTSSVGGLLEVPILLDTPMTDVDIRVLDSSADNLSLGTNFGVRVYHQDIIDPTRLS